MNFNSQLGQPQTLRIQLLGEFRVWVGERSIQPDQWKLRKAQSLLKLLALAPHHRLHKEALMEQLWPESDPELAANNLHRALYVLRRALVPPGAPGQQDLSFQGEWLCLRPELPLWVDVEAFEAAATQAYSSGKAADYQAALALYTGELLPEDAYEEWASQRREALHQDYLSLLLKLARLHETHDETGQAIEVLKRLLTAEPAHEEAHARLMRLYALSGQRQLAIRQYQVLQQALRRELDAEPDTETTRFYQEILTGHFPPSGSNVGTRPVSVSEPSPDRNAEQPRHNLPIQLTSFIGRERELAELRQLLLPFVIDKEGRQMQSLKDKKRLLTLTGAGGSGKTRLALECAFDLVDAFPSGVWLVELAGVSDPQLVPQAVATALGVREIPGKPLLESLVAYLKPRQILLVLDNCEHLIEACAGLAEGLLRTCPSLRILATSREALGLPGERLFQLSPLSFPDTRRSLAVEELAGYEAVQLFVERAQAVLPTFQISTAIAAAVGQICARLDGLPLAIELAAVRVNLLSVEQIAARLDDRFRLLTRGSRTAPDRQQTLQAALDWSYQLLSEPEQVLFRRLSVFAGGFDLEAAEAVGADRQDSSSAAGSHAVGKLVPASIFDLLSRLVDKSMVAVERIEGNRRYRLLETVRAYAWERLEENGEDEDTCRRHAEHFLKLAEQAEPALKSERQLEWLERLEREHDNLRAVLAWCLSRDEAETGQRLAGALWYFWLIRKPFEGLRWLEKVLASKEGSAVVRAKALVGAGFLAFYMWNFDQMNAHAEESLTLARNAGDQPLIANSLFLVSIYYDKKRDYTRALALDEQCLALARKTGDRWLTAFQLARFGWENVALCSDSKIWAARLKEAIRLAREVGDQRLIALTLLFAGGHAATLGDISLARRYAEEGLGITHALGDRLGIAFNYFLLGFITAMEGDFATSYRYLEERLSIERELDHKMGIVNSLNEAGVVAHAMGEDGKAQAFFEESLGLSREIGYALGGAMQFNSLGFLKLRRGEAEEAQGYFLESLRLYREMDDLYLLESNLYALSKIALLQGQPEQAVRWLGAVGPVFDDPLRYMAPDFKVWFNAEQYTRDFAAVKASLDEASFATAWEAGRALGLEGAIQEALEILGKKLQN